MLFARSLEGRVLPELAQATGGLTIRYGAAPTPDATSLPLTLADGTPAGALLWRAPAPGRSMIGSVLPLAILNLLCVAGLTLFFAFRAHRLAGQLVVDERDRRELAQRYESILDTAGDGIFGVDLHGQILFVNEAAATILGHPRSALAGADAITLILGGPAAAAEERGPGGLLGRALASGRAEVVNTECFRRADGACFPVEYVVTPLMQAEQVTGAVVVFRDVTKRRESEEDMVYRANFDPVTGLPNRNLLLERLEQELKRARREQNMVAVIFIDLDHFKAVNDSLGHRAGDVLLHEVGRRLQGAVREIDTVARLGGDELVVLLTHVTRPEAPQAVAGKLLQVLHEPFLLDGQAVQIGASMGVALYPLHGADSNILINQADLAMYQAKAAGRGTWRFASPAPPA
jgi:diguanylate cyclase (GGDEF)-like protein/PAS domain S-box-containing protein